MDAMRFALAVIVALVLAGTSAARAADSDNAALLEEVKSLRQMVLDLQQRLNRLEGRQAPAAQPAPGAAPVAAITAARPGANAGYVSPEAELKVSWSRLEREMGQRDVGRLLGPPSSKFTLDGRTVWFYHYPGIGSGSVFFTDAGRVSSRQSPFGWGW
jgi:hypothetical protein